MWNQLKKEAQVFYRSCNECTFLGHGSPEGKISVESEDYGIVYCKKQEKVVKEHGKKNLKEWLEGGQNECKYFVSKRDDD